MKIQIVVLFLFAAIWIRPDHLVAGYPPADLDLTRGKFLIATQKLTDPRFIQTVVLLISHDEKGAFGLIVNFPTDKKLSATFPDILRFKGLEEPLFYGGPVERSKVFLLLRTVKQPQNSVRVFDHVHLLIDQEEFTKDESVPARGEKFKVMAGYSGWGKGQLEAEIQSGHWLVWHADDESIFDKPAKTVWPELIQRASVIRASL